MKIIFLGPSGSPLLDYLRSVEDEVIDTADPVDLGFLQIHSPDFIVSYGYRHIIKKDILDRYRRRAINLHLAFLPWNRGADPNFWSFVENTPKGVTIHYLDEGIDSGDIIAQKEIKFSENETLRTSYNKLQEEMQAFFKKQWKKIRLGKCDRKKQEGQGSFHKDKDKEALRHLLTKGWDTPVSVLTCFKKESKIKCEAGLQRGEG
jgi:methionyl-tRNA formyltransferase